MRRYSSDSVKFDDAKPGALAEVSPGDQLRARGLRNEDGTTFAADEIVFGSFRNIAGTINGIDGQAKVLTVMDVFTKQPVKVSITPDSQLRKLPPTMAQRLAQRMKGGPPQGQPGNGTAQGQPTSAPAAQATSEGGGPMPRPGASASGDLNQALSRLPASSLADFHKGDAVMIVASNGGSDGVTAITLLGGVEPILAAPGGPKDMVLSPWSLGGGGGDQGGNP